MTTLHVLNLFIFGLALAGVKCAIICRDGWTTYGESCYFYGYDHVPVSFGDAQTFCIQKGGYLVEINNAHEDHFIQDFVKNVLPKHWWIGLSDQDIEKEFLWTHSHNPVSYTNWQPGQPDATESRDEDCVALSHDTAYTWHDAACGRLFYPICESSEEFGQTVG